MLKRINGEFIDVNSVIAEHFKKESNFANWILDQINSGHHDKFIRPLGDRISVLDIGANCGLFSA